MKLPDMPLIPVSTAAKVLHVPKSTLYHRIKQGLIPEEHVVRDLGTLRLRRTYLAHLIGAEHAPASQESAA